MSEKMGYLCFKWVGLVPGKKSYKNTRIIKHCCMASFPEDIYWDKKTYSNEIPIGQRDKGCKIFFWYIFSWLMLQENKGIACNHWVVMREKKDTMCTCVHATFPHLLQLYFVTAEVPGVVYCTFGFLCLHLYAATATDTEPGRAIRIHCRAQ